MQSIESYLSFGSLFIVYVLKLKNVLRAVIAGSRDHRGCPEHPGNVTVAAQQPLLNMDRVGSTVEKFTQLTPVRRGFILWQQRFKICRLKLLVGKTNDVFE